MPIVIKEIHGSTVVEKKSFFPKKSLKGLTNASSKRWWRNFRNTARAFVQKEERKNVEQH